MGYTTFGKYLRKLMIDNDETLQDLAKLFNVSIPFVSSVLVGKKNIPANWLELVSEKYRLTDEQKKELKVTFEESKNSIKIDLSTCNNYQRSLAIQFQRNLSLLSESEIKIIEDLFGDKDN